MHLRLFKEAYAALIQKGWGVLGSHWKHLTVHLWGPITWQWNLNTFLGMWLGNVIMWLGPRRFSNSCPMPGVDWTHAGARSKQPRGNGGEIVVAGGWDRDVGNFISIDPYISKHTWHLGKQGLHHQISGFKLHKLEMWALARAVYHSNLSWDVCHDTIITIQCHVQIDLPFNHHVFQPAGARFHGAARDNGGPLQPASASPLGCPGCMFFCLLFAPPWVIKKKTGPFDGLM